MNHTHTIATLDVSQSAYDEIAALLRAAAYDHVFMHDGTIDMTGIGLSVAPVIVAAGGYIVASNETKRRRYYKDTRGLPGYGMTSNYFTSAITRTAPRSTKASAQRCAGLGSFWVRTSIASFLRPPW